MYRHHKQYVERYERRVKEFREWKGKRELGANFRAGMTLDVLDLNHVWVEGRRFGLSII